MTSELPSLALAPLHLCALPFTASSDATGLSPFPQPENPSPLPTKSISVHRLRSPKQFTAPLYPRTGTTPSASFPIRTHCDVRSGTVLETVPVGSYEIRGWRSPSGCGIMHAMRDFCCGRGLDVRRAGGERRETKGDVLLTVGD
jgi:hypothetical protein